MSILLGMYRKGHKVSSHEYFDITMPRSDIPNSRKTSLTARKPIWFALRAPLPYLELFQLHFLLVKLGNEFRAKKIYIVSAFWPPRNGQKMPSAYQICFTATAVCIFRSRHWICIDTYCNIAFVLMLGSSGLKYLYCSTSFSRLSNWRWSLSLRPGSVSLMWFVSCWLSCLCK